MITKCSKIIQETGKTCGDDIDGPFHTRFCSEKCADRTNKAELEDLGITSIMMKEALVEYYKCRDLIDHQEMNNNSPETQLLSQTLPSPDEPKAS